jgi:hypothetical protein
MHKIVVIALASLLLPTMAAAQTYPTTKHRKDAGGISGDINGDISGTSIKKREYYYKRDLSNRPGCRRIRAGHYICR